MINKIGVHHTGPLTPNNALSSSKNITEDNINNAHRERTFNLSDLGYYIGYNVVIYSDGSWKQYRLLGEQTAAATGSNFNTFHVCMAGNFTKGVDKPTPEQLKSLKLIIISLIENKPSSIGIKVKVGATYSFTAFDIYPHRVLQPNHTSCYGDSLDDNFARLIAFNYLREKYNANPFMFKVLSTIIDFFNKNKFGRIKLGVKDHSDSNINYNL